MPEQPELCFDRPPVVSRLEQQFQDFDRANPHVYTLLMRFAREWRARHPGPCGIAMLYERARWQSFMETTGPEFKLCNNHRAYYARKIMAENPELDGLFNLRAVSH